jgi:environmental stress-induced protein Ves
MQKRSNQDYQTMPWKNGGGSTTELAVFPPGAGIDDFVWRLSRATVNLDGPFSHFAQIDRSLAILSGEGLVLHSDSEQRTSIPVRLTQASMPYQFAGELPIFAELCSGPVVDLNLMTRRDVCQHYMQRLTAGEHHVSATEAQQLLVYCAAGTAQIRIGGDDGAGQMQAGDLLTIDEEHERAGIRLQIRVAEDAILYLMRISFLNLGESNHAPLG